jgi:serine/threonine protein kinase
MNQVLHTVKNAIIETLDISYNTHIDKIEKTKYTLDSSGLYQNIIFVDDNRSSKFPIIIADDKYKPEKKYLIKAIKHLGIKGRDFKETFILSIVCGNNKQNNTNIVEVSRLYVKDLEGCPTSFIEMPLYWGNLTEYAYRSDRISLEECRISIMQIAKGLLYLKQKNVIHCDIKSDNILVSSKFVESCNNDDFGIKICDFEHSRLLVSGTSFSSPCNDINPDIYRPPEIILGLPFNYSVDLFALGGIMAFLLNRALVINQENTNYPFTRQPDTTSHLMMINDIFGPIPRKMFQNSQIDISKAESKGFVFYFKEWINHNDNHIRFAFDLFMKITMADPEARLTNENVIYHPYFFVNK